MNGGLCECGCGLTANHRFVKGHNAHLRVGEKNPMWLGGRNVNHFGYVVLSIEGATKFEHVLIAEKAIGHELPPEADVHHVNGIRDDNRNENLVVCEDRAYHMLLHRRQRALEACGDANARPCMYCGGHDRQEDITVFERADGRTSAYHRSCNRENRRRVIARRTAKELQ